MKTPVTLKKLSDMLNLSISTISRALKDHPDISKETREKVQELAATLEYEPNENAVNLRTNNSKEFGVIIPAISNYFYHFFISSLEEEARRYGYSLIILQSGDDPAIEQANVKRCRKARLSGIFISLTSSTEDISEILNLEKVNIPVIFFDKVPPFEACNKVCVGDVHATEIAADTLIKKSKKKILAIFGDKHLSITQARMVAFIDYMQKHHMQKNYNVVHALNPAEAATLLQIAYRSKTKPDAIFCMSDEILTGVMKAVQIEKINVPKDIGIVAISDGFIPQLYYPEITYAETSGYKLGKLAFSRMIACLAGTPFVQNIVAHSVLIPGGSI
ncbi:LacI family DNA-binding transcriptional regulator [Arcticibacter eurypsychrophilus]|uniref:LacI family DNA-binding transcriptional regulator n=1 Tax=Arcticibacter eurypsychrophilus TaxID=1434752 RepID=UPI001112EE85|nr:LacI family DNA-binding transcriptional regulator [Arcticibacter eurypsychrophilus]